MAKYLIEIEYEHYVSEDGHHLRREEDGQSPNGNQFNGRWVLRDQDMQYVDHDQYRHDIMERHGFRTTTLTVREFLDKEFA